MQASINNLANAAAVVALVSTNLSNNAADSGGGENNSNQTGATNTAPNLIEIQLSQGMPSYCYHFSKFITRISCNKKKI